MNRLRREERGGILVLVGDPDPGLHRHDGDGRRRRPVVHAQAPAAEPRRRRRASRPASSTPRTGRRASRAATPTSEGEHAAREIANRARQYAADPEAADYAPDPLPATLYNANIANQSKLDVVINSTTYTDDNDYDDDDGSTTPADPKSGDPCFVHTRATTSRRRGGHWIDVRVKENDLPSLFGAIGLPLRAERRARAGRDPPGAERERVPAARGPEQRRSTKVQVRYYDECRDPSHTLLARARTVRPQAAPADRIRGRSSRRAAAHCGRLRASSRRTPAGRRPDRSFALTVPSYGGCGQDYLAGRHAGAAREHATST